MALGGRRLLEPQDLYHAASPRGPGTAVQGGDATVRSGCSPGRRGEGEPALNDSMGRCFSAVSRGAGPKGDRRGEIPDDLAAIRFRLSGDEQRVRRPEPETTRGNALLLRSRLLCGDLFLNQPGSFPLSGGPTWPTIRRSSSLSLRISLTFSAIFSNRARSALMPASMRNAALSDRL